jgi:hypothetical protein
MSKVIAASMVFVLVIGTSVFATTTSTVQQQLTDIALENLVNLNHGDQCASSLQNLVVNNAQCGEGLCNSGGREAFYASLGQSGSAMGDCGVILAQQGLTIEGAQQQTIGDGIGAKAQLQSVGMTAEQFLGRSDGEGSANAVHTIVLQGDQEAENSAGALNESSTIIGMQTSSVNGAPGSTAVVDGTMTVMTSQTQGTL